MNWLTEYLKTLQKKFPKHSEKPQNQYRIFAPSLSAQISARKLERKISLTRAQEFATQRVTTYPAIIGPLIGPEKMFTSARAWASYKQLRHCIIIIANFA